MGNTEKFDMIANRYDTPERVRIAKLSADAIREYINRGKTQKAIDFGCGTGLVGMHLLNDFESMLFLDTSENMIHEVRRKISECNVHNADTLSFDFEKDSLTNLRADYIFMAQVLLHIKDFQPVLQKLHDVLYAGGHLIIIDFDKNVEIDSELVHNGFDQAALTSTMKEMGYKNVQSRTFYYGNRLFMNRDASLFILDAQK